MRLAICGHGRHGKGTAASWFAANTALRYEKSTSEAAAELVWSMMVERGIEIGGARMKWMYPTPADCWEDRHSYRDEWARIIWEHNQPDGITLYEGMVARNDILEGIRQPDELRACLAHGLADVAIWIDASRRLPAEPSTSCKVSAADCHFVIDNNGPWSDTDAALRALCDTLNIKTRRRKRKSA